MDGAKEGMAGQVQMVYIDPPYGIKYGSNFQPFVDKRDVKDKNLKLARFCLQVCLCDLRNDIEGLDGLMDVDTASSTAPTSSPLWTSGM